MQSTQLSYFTTTLGSRESIGTDFQMSVFVPPLVVVEVCLMVENRAQTVTRWQQLSAASRPASAACSSAAAATTCYHHHSSSSPSFFIGKHSLEPAVSTIIGSQDCSIFNME